jgi:hypothetical protein
MPVWSRRILAAVIVASGFVLACPKKNDSVATDAAAPAPTKSFATTPSGSVPSSPNAACAVAYASYPSGQGPSPGDDLSNVVVPMVVPEGASITIVVRRTGHEVRVKGPAILRPCTHDEPDVVLVATGEASVEGTTPIRPGSELFLATPAFVAVFGRATLRVRSLLPQSSWEIDDGDVTITNLDVPKQVKDKDKDKGFYKRFEDGGILLTRCGVQAAAAASAERLLLGFTAPDAAAPLPSSSIGILTAQQIKHARERVLDCAFAEAFALACDQLALESDAQAPGCGGISYVKVREHIARAIASGPIPPGSPPAKTPAP